MPLRNHRPMTWKMRGCSDAIDGSNTFPGAMKQMSNLVPATDTADQWVPRPARDLLANLIQSQQFVNASVISGLFVFGDYVYGLCATLRNPGRDEPFVCNATTGQFGTVANVTMGNCPTTQPPTGATVKPLFTKVGGRILVTHPGFPGGRFNPPFLGTFVGNTTQGSNVITGNFASSLFLPGQIVTDAAGALQTPTFIVSQPTSVDFQLFANGTQGSNILTVGAAPQVAIGQEVGGAGISGTVTAIGPAAGQITISIPAQQTFTNGVVFFHGNQMVVSQNATASVNQETFTASSTGSTSTKFGWFDVSGTTLTKTGTTTNLSQIMTITDASGMQPGYLVTGPGIPANTTVSQVVNPFTQGVAVSANSGDTSLAIFLGNTILNQSPPFILPISGQVVSGPGITAGTTVSGSPTVVISGSLFLEISVPLSAAVNQTLPPGNYIFTFSGGLNLVLSQAATSSNSGQQYTFTGGTVAAPLWAAGDTAINQLPSTPLGVGTLNGRAYFACGQDGIPFSDSLLPCVRTNATQALVPGNGLAVTHCVGQPLNTPITGGIIQALYAFQGASAVQQISGDQATNNLQMDPLNVGTGTLGPATIVPTTLGMMFVSPEGVRRIDFTGQISQPLGEAGTGVTNPFINVLDPTRMIAAANGDVLRISLQVAPRLAQPYEEWWYDISREIWSGPHTLQTSCMAPYVNTFITAAIDVPAQLYKSAAAPSGLADFEEDGNTLTWTAQTVLLPDSDDMHMMAVLEGTLAAQLPMDMVVTVSALDENGYELDQVALPGNFTMPLYRSVGGVVPTGSNVWGSGLWYAQTAFLHQFQLPWSKTLVFKQISFKMTGIARYGMVLGNLRLRYQELDYMLQNFPSVPLDISVPALPTAPIANGSPMALVATSTAQPFTPIGAVLAQIAHLGPAVPQAQISLAFNQNNALTLVPYSDVETVAVLSQGSNSFTTMLNVIFKGWLVGHGIADSAGAIPPGTYITGISPTGLSVTMSRAALFTAATDTIQVYGTDLVTNWTSPWPVGQIVGELQVTAPGYLTSYLPFVVTVIQGFPILTGPGGVVLTTPSGTPLTFP